MSDEKMSSSEVAYRAVLAVQESQRRAEQNSFQVDTSNPQSTPVHVWGALLGLVIAAFAVDASRPISFITAPIMGIAFGWGFVWLLRKTVLLFFATLGMVFRGIGKILKG
jgi:hypothetical protein